MSTSGSSASGNEPVDLRDRVVIVTGGASGIGEQVVRKLLAQSAQVAIVDANPDALERVGADLPEAFTIPANITVQDDVDRTIAAVMAEYGRIDGLVNNAGVSLHEPVATVSPESLLRVFDINVVGALRMLQAVVPPMREAGFGRIVNVTSGTVRMAPLGSGPYAATKAALNMLSAVARGELAATGIAVSEVLPSMTASNFNGAAYKLGQELIPGVIVQSPEYPARAIVHALRYGEPTIDVPHGTEDPSYLAG